jgi:hypothetical protein
MHVPVIGAQRLRNFLDDEGSGHMMERDYTGMFENHKKLGGQVFRR